ncbi:MAG: hypothetical protein IPM71_06150 [Bacteroidota bacterium]|nr:MAG: hypothetical protein IPM71_06150 [Bacteroidota bacterium]
MKNIIKSFFTLFLLASLSATLYAQSDMELVGQCAASAGDVTFLKDFVATLDAGTPGGKPPQVKFSLVLSKNTNYRFSICNAPDSEGEAVLQLYDLNMLQGATYMESLGKDFPYFDFKCQKTGVYHVFIFFKDGKPGKAAGIMSFVEKL